MNSSYGITSKFRVTIPKGMREKIGLTKDDRVLFAQKGGEISLQKAPSLSQLAQEVSEKFHKSGLPPATQKDIDDARLNFYKPGGK